MNDFLQCIIQDNNLDILKKLSTHNNELIININLFNVKDPEVISFFKKHNLYGNINDLELSIEYNNPEIFELTLNNLKNSSINYNFLIKKAIIYGNQDILNIIHSHNNKVINSNHYSSAIVYTKNTNSSIILDWLFSHNIKPLKDIYEICMKFNSIYTMEWLFSHNILPDLYDVYLASLNDKLNMIIWYKEKGVDFSLAYNGAIEGESLSILRWLYYNNYKPDNNIFKQRIKNKVVKNWIYTTFNKKRKFCCF